MMVANDGGTGRDDKVEINFWPNAGCASSRIFFRSGNCQKFKVKSEIQALDSILHVGQDRRGRDQPIGTREI